jgi:hypothetical protein
MVLWMAPAFAALGLAGMLLVSLRVRGMQEATQLGGLFVLPVIALVVGEVRGAVLLASWGSCSEPRRALRFNVVQRTNFPQRAGGHSVNAVGNLIPRWSMPLASFVART